MNKSIINKITDILKIEIESILKDCKEKEQDEKIKELMISYMPYIDIVNGKTDIEIIRSTETLYVNFRIEKEPYLIKIITY